MSDPIRIELEGSLEVCEQECGHAYDAISIGDTDLGTKIREEMRKAGMPDECEKYKEYWYRNGDVAAQHARIVVEIWPDE